MTTPESSKYFGHSADAIVAIGVASQEDDRRMLAIAAGDSYQHLNLIECEMTFRPTLFEVIVGVTDRNITVTPLGDADDLYAHAENLTHVVMRQLELISNDQTNLYVSVVGNSLNSSISDYITAQNGTEPPSLKEATLPGLENAFTAMIDDMLVAYASAQLMIEKDVVHVNATMAQAALRPGENIYIYAIFVINAVILLLAAIEGARTRLWKDMAAVDYLDPGTLISSTYPLSRGNSNVGSYGANRATDERGLKAKLHEGIYITIESKYGLLDNAGQG